MIPPACGPFVHRLNRDGTTDSICRYCFVTVFTSTWETDLANAEREHVCDTSAMERWTRMQRGESGPGRVG
jgi:hypothetical protein